MKRWPEILLISIAGLALVGFLWDGSLVNSDDAIYADIGRTMAQNGDPWGTAWHQAELFEKPPVLFWSLAISGAVLGFDDFSARLPGALAAVGCLIVLLSLGRRLGLNRQARLLSVALLLASGCFYFTARRPMTDTLLLFFGLLSLDAWLAARVRPRRLVVWGAALGAAVLTKWVAAAPFVLLAIAEGALPHRRGPSPLRSRWLLAGFGAFVLVAAPWHIIQTVRHGAEFWDVYLGYHVIGRASAALVVETSPLFYGYGALLRETGLVLLWAFAAVALALRPRWGNARFLLLWLLLTVVPIHFAGTRLYHYLLPAIPAFSLAGALAVQRWLNRRVVATAMAIFAGFFFLVNNGADLLRPDYSPGTKRLGDLMRAVPEGAEIAAMETYDVTATWYAGRPVKMWTLDPSLAQQWSVDMMERAGAVELMGPENLVGRLAHAKAFALLAPAELEPTLDRVLRAVGRPFRGRIEGDRVLFLSR